MNIKSMSGVKYCGKYIVVALLDDGRTATNSFDLKEKKWGDWCINIMPFV